jgi:hypothetical protein
MDEPELHYALRLVPAGRLPFRRWRFELWHGPRLVVTGWRTSEAHAERALSGAAARLAHRLRGLHLLRPEAATVSRPLRHGGVVRVRCGAVSCVLVPAADAALQARSAA